MAGLAELALKLDSDTNNTSLALAFELPDGQVLLFPGDAQVGNWESWSELSWKDGDRTITGKDLLARTTLYKIGHHGSHNATLREKGLELMVRRDLVALLPVDQDVAHNKKKWKQMPFVPLCNRLQEKTQGRILRADHDQFPLAAELDSWSGERVVFSKDRDKALVVPGIPGRSLYVEVSVPVE